jgi:subtilisin family serine protease
MVLGVSGAGAEILPHDDPSAAAWENKVHPRVARDAEVGPVDFLVVLEEQADLSTAAHLEDKRARGRFVYDSLTEVARRTQAPLLDLVASRGLPHRSYWIANMVLVRGRREDVEVIARRGEVLRIDANPIVHVEIPRSSSMDNASTDAIEWNVTKIGADLVWAMGFTGAGVVIGGQDTGYEWTHPALMAHYRGWNGATATHDYNWHDAIHSGGGSCGADSVVPCDDDDHGTHTMGTMIGDDGGENRIGVSPGATWIGCRNMDETEGTPATYAECFQWFVAPTDLAGLNPDPAKAPDVISNSWACPATEGCSHGTLRTVVENTRAAGIVVVASAGNEGPNCNSVDNPPAIYDAAFSVGATNSSDGIAFFSSRGLVTVDGSNRLKPDVAAPGVSVRSSVRGATYGTSNGTSMAGPHVAGLVALLLDARPDLAGQVEVIETLIRAAALPLFSGQQCNGSFADTSPNFVFGYGRIDAVATLTGDADNDTASNLTDCAPADGGVWTAPQQPISNLAISKSGPSAITFTWSEPPEAGSTSVTYDLLRSTSPAPSGFASGSCVSSSLSSTTTSDPAPPPGPQFYLARVRNGCGEQLGAGSPGTPERVGVACP